MIAKKITLAVSAPVIIATAVLTACGSDDDNPVSNAEINCNGASQAVSEANVKCNHAQMAYAVYSDSLSTAQDLQSAVDTFLETPDETNLLAARSAYKAARKPYQQSEIMRWDENITNGKGLANGGGLESVDAWEGQVNAWPLDESKITHLIDNNLSTAIDQSLLLAQEGALTPAQAQAIKDEVADLVAGTTALEAEDSVAVEAYKTANGVTTDAAITAVITELRTEGFGEANVTTGVHAIEFMLWDKDSLAEGAGTRTEAEFICQEGMTDTVECGNAAYLKAATDLLVTDLTAMQAEWAPSSTSGDTKTYKPGTLAFNFLNSNQGLDYIAQAIASMAVGELGGARLSAGLWRPNAHKTNPSDPDYTVGHYEEEHDCFSDLSHVAVYYNFQGVVNAFEGSYTQLNGDIVSGLGLGEYIKSIDVGTHDKLAEALAKVQPEMDKLLAYGEDNGISFDDIIAMSEAYYEQAEPGAVAKTTELVTVETAITELGHIEAIVSIDVKDALELAAFDADAIGETD